MPSFAGAKGDHATALHLSVLTGTISNARASRERPFVKAVFQGDTVPLPFEIGPRTE